MPKKPLIMGLSVIFNLKSTMILERVTYWVIVKIRVGRYLVQTPKRVLGWALEAKPFPTTW